MRLGSAAFVGLMVCAAPAVAFQNEPTGFRGLAWGTDITTVQTTMRLVEDDGATKYYLRSGDAQTMGGAKLKDLSYGFYKGKLKNVILQSAEYSDQALIDAFVAQFGEGSQPNQFMRDRIWRGVTATAGVDCNEIVHTCAGILTSTAMDAVEKADKANAAANAGKDF
jgi:hypothetical protein